MGDLQRAWTYRGSSSRSRWTGQHSPARSRLGCPPAAALTDCPQWEPDLRSNLYLTSDEAKFVTGAELVIDGGYTAQ